MGLPGAHCSLSNPLLASLSAPGRPLPDDQGPECLPAGPEPPSGLPL